MVRIDDKLRKALTECNENVADISRATGVDRASVSRFIAQKHSLRFDLAARLADYLGLALVEKSTIERLRNSLDEALDEDQGNC